MPTIRKLWIAIAVLALLSPLGVVVPALFGAGGAWGEWGVEEVEKLLGFAPEGMKRLAERWKAPLPDYAVPGQGEGLVREGFGYLLTGLLGVAVTAGAAFLVLKLLARPGGDGGKE